MKHERGFAACLIVVVIDASQSPSPEGLCFQSALQAAKIRATCTWQADSDIWRQELKMPASYKPWTAQAHVRLAGLPKQDRVRDLVDLVAADRLCGESTRGRQGKDVRSLMQPCVVDVSQSHKRRVHTSRENIHPCLTTSSSWYDYRLDRMVVPHESFLLQGHSHSHMLQGCPVLTSADFRELAGEGFALPSVATVLAAVFCVKDFGAPA